MPYNIQQINDRYSWEQIIAPWHPNTFLQSWEWGETQSADGEGVIRLAVRDQDNIMAVANVILVNARRGRHYLIPHGPLYASEKHAPACLEAIITYLKNKSRQDNSCALRIAPLSIATPENHSLYQNLNFRPAPLHVHTELTWVLDINRNADQILAGMRKTTRHAINKAQACGLSCEVITDISAIERFWPLYDTTRQRHHFVPFSKKFLSSQWQAFAAHNQVFSVIARYQDKDVAAGIFMDYAGTVFYHHGASVKLSSQIPAAHLVQWRAIEEAMRRGANRYNFWGIAPDNEPNHPFAGITVFKKGFGGTAMDYLHAQDLPFSMRYWQLWLVDTYRKYRRGF